MSVETLRPFCPSQPPAADDDLAAVVAGELMAQHGTDVLAIVAAWTEDAHDAYATAFWRQVVNQIRRTVRSDMAAGIVTRSRFAPSRR